MFANFTDAAGRPLVAAAHASFITGVTSDSCDYVMQVPEEKRCSFVRSTPDCKEMILLVDYMQLIVCVLSPMWLGVVVVVLWCWFMFAVIMVNSELVVNPILLLIADRLRMSEYLAGIALLAPANSYADVIFRGRSDNSDTASDHVVTLGSALFVTGFVGGLVLVMRPLREHGFDVLWTSGCYAVGVLYVTAITENDDISVSEACGCAAIYVVFVAVVVGRYVGHVLRWRRRHGSETNASAEMKIKKASNQKRRHNAENIRFRRVTFRSVDEMADGSDTTIAAGGQQERPSMCAEFRHFMWRMAMHSCARQQITRQVYFVTTFLVKILNVLVVPMYNRTLPNNGWCKLSVLVNLFLIPPVFLFAFEVWAWKWYVSGLAVSLVAAMVVYFTSVPGQAPRYHWVFLYIGLAMALVLTCYAANEMACAMSALFRLLSVKQETMTLGVTVWAIGMNDLATSVYVVYSGHPNMALASCFAGPMLNILIGTFITFMRKNLIDTPPDPKSRTGTMSLNTAVVLLSMLVLHAVAVSLSQFKQRRSTGFMLLLSYAVYMGFVLLDGLDLLHGYGTDHYDEAPFEM